MTVAVILGSAFKKAALAGKMLRPVEQDTPWGQVTLYEHPESGGLVLFRHGLPHRWLPNQIPYRAHAAALAARGCRGLLVTSSVGVLTPELPLFKPLLVSDLLMPENRLPSGESCTIFDHSRREQGHLVLEEGLFSHALAGQLRALCAEANWPVAGDAVFAYVGGPRTKSAAENRFWRVLGAEINSMTLGPEVVLANELEIPCVGLTVGHKYSLDGGIKQPLDGDAIERSLVQSRTALEAIASAFLMHGVGVPFKNRIHRLTPSSL